MNRSWLLLLLAGIAEVGWVVGLKHANSAGEWLLTVAAIVISFWGLIYVSNLLPVGTVYAVFTGIGAAGTVLAETVFFGAPFEPLKAALIVLLIIGIAGLKMTDGKEAA